LITFGELLPQIGAKDVGAVAVEDNLAFGDDAYDAVGDRLGVVELVERLLSGDEALLPVLEEGALVLSWGELLEDGRQRLSGDGEGHSWTSR
ncbi:MAG: hypothetical protein WBA10_14225, partial [Elainellaceae cyanobacterium]